jgi:DNA-binding winged helix-turn-helix (wHTH) protein
VELGDRAADPVRAIRSGAYEVDLEAGELRRNGLKVPLQDQPFKVLLKLVARPGALVTREELQAELWGPHPNVDAELGLNTAVKKLRVAFRDTADNPRFIETLPKRGYRFIAPVRDVAAEAPLARAASLASIELDGRTAPEVAHERPRGAAASDPERSTLPSSGMRPFWRRRVAWLAASILLVGGVLTAWIPTIGSSTFLARAGARRIETVYRSIAEPDGSGAGIGGYDLKSPGDQALSFDYDHSGKLDHLVFYRPGIGFFRIVQHVGGRFSPIYQGGGVGDYDLKVSADRAFAFDYDHSGKLDHLVLFRRGAGVLRILANDGRGLFRSAYRPDSVDRAVPPGEPPVLADQVFAFDYDHSGRADHLLFYQSGQGIVGVWTNVGGQLAQVGERGVQSLVGAPSPIAGEQAFAFDHDHSGKLDHLVVYRPGDGAVAIFRNTNGAFTPVYRGQGLGGYDLKSVNDRMLAVDYDGSGKLDHLLLYRPGAGVAAILRNSQGIFTPVFQGQGLGGYDLMSVSDRALAFDFDGSGKLDHLLLYRPGMGVARIVQFR